MTKEKEQDEIIPSPSYLDSCVKTSFDFPDYPLTTSKVFRTGRPSISAPHSRSCSMRKVNRDKNALLIDRKRRNSLPMDLADLACPYISSDIQSTCESSQDTFQRVRSFKMTSKGLVNHGDSLRNKSKSKTSSRSSSLKDNRRQRISSDTSDDTCSSVSSCSGGYYRVVILGSPSVGKTALMNQFMTSEYTGGLDLGTEEDSDTMSVSVLLDGEESSLEFLDVHAQDSVGGGFFDAFVFVYSVDDVASFESVEETMYHLRHDLGSDRPFILVANKIDLVRNRKVSPEEGKKVAHQHDAKYIETSVTLHHHIDELLVGILRQIRIKLNIIYPEVTQSKNSKKGPRGLLKRIFRLSRKNEELVENVFE